MSIPTAYIRLTIAISATILLAMIIIALIYTPPLQHFPTNDFLQNKSSNDTIYIYILTNMTISRIYDNDIILISNDTNLTLTLPPNYKIVMINPINPNGDLSRNL